jgi:DNA-directed RNA polymerase sigma subunit (sigma70/sigma32)
MVVSLATSSRHLALPHGDRVSAGLEGLAIGLWRFDPGLPYALGTFVLHWVRCKMGRAASTQVSGFSCKQGRRLGGVWKDV